MENLLTYPGKSKPADAESSAAGRRGFDVAHKLCCAQQGAVSSRGLGHAVGCFLERSGDSRSARRRFNSGSSCASHQGHVRPPRLMVKISGFQLEDGGFNSPGGHQNHVTRLCGGRSEIAGWSPACPGLHSGSMLPVGTGCTVVGRVSDKYRPATASRDAQRQCERGEMENAAPSKGVHMQVRVLPLAPNAGQVGGRECSALVLRIAAALSKARALPGRHLQHACAVRRSGAPSSRLYADTPRAASAYGKFNYRESGVGGWSHARPAAGSRGMQRSRGEVCCSDDGGQNAILSAGNGAERVKSPHTHGSGERRAGEHRTRLPAAVGGQHAAGERFRRFVTGKMRPQPALDPSRETDPRGCGLGSPTSRAGWRVPWLEHEVTGIAAQHHSHAVSLARPGRAG